MKEKILTFGLLLFVLVMIQVSLMVVVSGIASAISFFIPSVLLSIQLALFIVVIQWGYKVFVNRLKKQTIEFKNEYQVYKEYIIKSKEK